ncbi:helix-turn-helix domain-containing protein [Brachyspira pilosicoli]|uniref:Two-component system regulator n=2 Tax=Brachyspira pilosicoli TaxID=52584 RepID=D8IDI9_BRAP9|nr:LuxR C-terminal-related transcriptional regulator [Brachyspira pilosicoli]ADK31212.1 two-component system regulator [Brachyspira pilosicoli 95/1000]AFR69360.1 two-component system regulator [Brachyspira pilosicoli B2904]MBW5383495.1 LuxR family transcriptional regulator [Brachyspira pilosicoli]WIH85227.1 LuxR C-terminal-related transcriptional regulator [Brachyspira pilosicoli]WIH87487.1 LuxR C-terminal-related transcriptional regulator [Brachyspira pilosicoli]
MNYVFNYLLLIFYLLSFVIGFSTIFYSIVYYIIERVLWLKYYIIFLFTFGILIFIRTIRLITLLTLPSFTSNNIFNMLYFFILTLAMALMLYFIPAFLYRFLKIKWSIKTNLSYLILSVFYFVLSIIGILTSFNIYILSSMIFYISIFYLLVVGFLNYKNIEDKTIKFIVKVLGIITILIYPVLIYQLIIYRKDFMNINSIDVTLMLFYTWWNLVMLGYLLWYFISMIKSNNNRISDSLCEKNDESDNNIKLEEKIEVNDFNLTKREKQILSYLLSGKTNKEISLIFDISLNTVNNHVANIYYKSGVKNRVELVNKFSKY